jgi:hypothetical protein
MRLFETRHGRRRQSRRQLADRAGASCVANRRAAPRACLHNSETAKFNFPCSHRIAIDLSSLLVCRRLEPAAPGDTRRDGLGAYNTAPTHGQEILTGVTPAKLSSFLGFDSIKWVRSMGGEGHFPEALPSRTRGLMRQETPPVDANEGNLCQRNIHRSHTVGPAMEAPCRLGVRNPTVSACISCQSGGNNEAFHRSAIEPSSVSNGVRLVERLERAGSRSRGPPQ